jgi:uncharacterized protein (TIRG00374 family)
MNSCRPEPEGARRRTAAWVWRVVILLAAGLAATVLLMQTGDISGSLMVARRLAWSVLMLAVVTQFLSYLSNGELLRATVRQTGHTLSLSRATMIEIASATLSMAPGGNVSCAAAVYRWTRKGGVPPSSAAVTGVVVAMFNAAALLVFGIVSALLLIGQHRLAGNEALAVAFVSVGIVAMIVAAVLAATWPPALRFLLRTAGRVPLLRRTSLLQRADDRIAQLRDIVARLRSGRWGGAAAGAALNMAFDAATLALVFYAAGTPIGAATLLAGYGLPIMLGQASFLPGGLAVTEVSMSAVYISLGLRPSVVIASVVTYRLVSLWLPALVGLPLIAWLQIRGRKRR